MLIISLLEFLFKHYIGTNIYTKPGQFDNRQSKVRKTHPNYDYLNIELQKIILDYQQKLLGLNKFTSIDVIIKHLKEVNDVLSFFNAIDGYIAELKKGGKKKTAQIYQSTRKFQSLFLWMLFLKYRRME